MIGLDRLILEVAHPAMLHIPGANINQHEPVSLKTMLDNFDSVMRNLTMIMIATLLEGHLTLFSGGVSSLCADFQAMLVHLTCSPQTVYKFILSLFVHDFELTSLCLCFCSYSFGKDSVFCLKVCCAWTHGGSICGAETGLYTFSITIVKAQILEIFSLSYNLYVKLRQLGLL